VIDRFSVTHVGCVTCAERVAREESGETQMKIPNVIRTPSTASASEPASNAGWRLHSRQPQAWNRWEETHDLYKIVQRVGGVGHPRVNSSLTGSGAGNAGSLIRRFSQFLQSSSQAIYPGMISRPRSVGSKLNALNRG
jgi:hypothetical protein